MKPIIPVMRTALEQIQELHKPVKRWLLSEDSDFSFHTLADVIEYATDTEYFSTEIDPSKEEYPFFEICEECGRIESEQLKEMGEGACYRESLHPCETRKLADAGLTDHMARTNQGENNE